MTSEQIKKRNANPAYQKNLKEWRKKNRGRINLQARLRRYGLTLAQYTQMLEAQGHTCKVCLKPFTVSKQIHVDHNHTSGQVRAILCGACNAALGYAKESTFTLQRLLAYLQWAEPETSLTYESFADLPSRRAISARSS